MDRRDFGKGLAGFLAAIPVIAKGEKEVKKGIIHTIKWDYVGSGGMHLTCAATAIVGIPLAYEEPGLS